MRDAKAFVDTNVLLRGIQSAMPLHQEATALIAKAREDGNELWVSQQVIREYIAQVTRPGILVQSLTADEIAAKVKTIRSVFRIADVNDDVTDKLIELIKEYPTGGRQIHDANIVATMLVYGIDTLLTQNVQDMKRFSNRIQIMPLIENSK